MYLAGRRINWYRGNMRVGHSITLEGAGTILFYPDLASFQLDLMENMKSEELRWREGDGEIEG